MKVNVTGFSASQNGTKRGSRKGIVCFSTLLVEMLKDAGYDADYNIKAKKNIVFVQSLSFLGNSWYEQALDILQKNPNSIIALDDWDVRTTYRIFRRLVSGEHKFKSHPNLDQKVLDRYMDVFQKIVEGKYPILFPAYKTGDHDMLGIIGKKTFVDPSIYVHEPNEDYGDFFLQIFSKDNYLLPVHASNDKKMSKVMSKKDYTMLNVRGESEANVYGYYKKHRIVLAPPHYHDGSGWWRNRYSLANMAKAVVIEDENGPFGERYTIIRDMVEPKTIDYLFQLQDKVYHETILSKQENIKKLKELL